jgi:hypothetical protein
MADYLTTDTELTSVADAIREKGGTSAALEWPQGYVDAIGAISSGGATLYKIDNNGGRTAPDTITIDGTTYDENSSTVRMGYAPAGVTVSFCYDYQRRWVFDSVVITGSSTQVPVTTRTTEYSGYTVYMFTMPDADVTINSYYDD